MGELDKVQGNHLAAPRFYFVIFQSYNALSSTAALFILDSDLASAPIKRLATAPSSLDRWSTARDYSF